jgi:hypothetical protein
MVAKYHWADQVNEDGMGEVCSTHERGKKCIVLFGRRETKWPLERSRCGWKGNIKKDVTDRGL